jgi:hypothetical protein
MIGFIGRLYYNSLDYNSSHIELVLNNEPLTVYLLILGLVSSLWSSITKYDSFLRINYLSFHDPVRTAFRTTCLTVPLLFCVSVAMVMHVHQNPMPSNSLFRVATGTLSGKPSPADGHIAAFRRHVTIYRVSHNLPQNHNKRYMGN